MNPPSGGSGGRSGSGGSSATGTGGTSSAPASGGRSGSGGTTPSGGSGGTSGNDASAPPADMGSNPPTPPSGMTVSINGMAVPKEKVIVFLHIGHSNMAGRVTTPESLRPFNFETHPRLWQYTKGGMWKAAKEPLSGDSMTSSCGGVGCAGLPNGAGPGMSILRAGLAAAPDAHFVSIGRGQSGLTQGVCRSFRKGGLLYNYVMEPAMELKGKVTFGGIWAMFGQSEVNDNANTSKFGECLAGVATDMRNDLGEPDLPFLLGDWEEGVRGGLSTTSSIGRTLIPQMKALPMQLKRSLLIPTMGLPLNPLDGQHYDLTGYKLWAERGIELLKMNGWMSWAP
ncbi:MAG TPA: sialate O-acetylesterase [Polyangia bacterium]